MALRELLATFGIQVDDKQLKNADRSLEGFIGTLRNVASATAAFFVGRAVANLVKGSIDAASHIEDMSKRVGLSTTALQEWAFAGKLVGVSMEEIGSASGFLQKNAAAAAAGGESQGKAFAKLGITLRDGKGQLKDTDALLMDVAQGLAGVENPTQRTALALEVLGRGGKALLPLFSQGAEGVAKARAEIHALGGLMSKEFIEQADEAGDNIDRFKMSVQGLRNALVIQLLPWVNRAVTWLIRMVRVLRESPRALALVKTGVAVLSALIAGSLVKSVARLLITFGPLIATTLLWAAAIAAVYLVIEDLYTFLQGGESVLGKWVLWLDEVLDRLAKFVPMVQFLRSIGVAIGDAFADSDLEASRNLIPTDPRGDKGKNAVAEATNRARASIGLAPIAATRERQVAVRDFGGKGGVTVAPNISAPVTINAPGGDPKLIARELKRHFGGILKDAASVLPQGTGG